MSQHPAPGAPDPYRATPAQLAPEQERQYAMLAHLGGILGILPSLIIYLVFKDRGTFIKDQAREALNFQITVFIGYVGTVVLGIVLAVAGVGLPPLNVLLWIANIVLCILAGVAANKGEAYRYPFALRLVS